MLIAEEHSMHVAGETNAGCLTDSRLIVKLISPL